jgi:uncharacterized membrane protein
MIMRKVFIFVFLLNIIFIAASLFILPDSIATHFSGGGEPDSFGSKYFFAAVLAISETFIFVIFLFIPYIVMKSPPGLMNLPNKKYWLREENRPALKSKISTFFYEFGTAFFVFMFAIYFLAVKANFSEPVRLKNSLLYSMLIVLLLYTAYWFVKFFLSFRIPNEIREDKTESEFSKMTPDG